MKHYKTVMFVQISESPTAQTYWPLCWRLSGDGSVATPSFSLATYLVTMVTTYLVTMILTPSDPWLHIHNSFINPTRYFTFTNPTCNSYSNASLQTIHSSTLVETCHLHWNAWLKMQSSKSMSQNNNFAYHL